jgi:hypothetical protein
MCTGLFKIKITPSEQFTVGMLKSRNKDKLLWYPEEYQYHSLGYTDVQDLGNSNISISFNLMKLSNVNAAPKY